MLPQPKSFTCDTLKSTYILFYQLDENVIIAVLLNIATFIHSFVLTECHFYLQLVKRPKQRTPGKCSPASKKWRSPYQKRLHGSTLPHLSPKKSSTSKRLAFGQSVLKVKKSDLEKIAQVTMFRIHYVFLLKTKFNLFFLSSRYQLTMLRLHLK